MVLANNNHHHQLPAPSPRRRGTVVTESTRFSIASSSKCDGNDDADFDSERVVCNDVCDWDVVAVAGNASFMMAANAENNDKNNTTTYNNYNNNNTNDDKQDKGGNQIHRQQQKQRQGQKENSSTSKSHLLATFSFSKRVTAPPLPPVPLPWRQQKQKHNQSLSCSRMIPVTAKATTKLIHESKLRKKVQHLAQQGDWESIRALLSKHPLVNVIPEKKVPAIGTAAAAGGGGDGVSGTHRRPSYESYSSGRRSFTTGKESAAAAAAIQHAALLDCCESNNSRDYSYDDDDNDDSGIVGEPGVEEGRACRVNVGRGDRKCSFSLLRCRNTRDDRPDIGENILHDICRYQPQLDVLETLLSGLRDRYYTIGTDRLGRTPLHVAAASGAHSSIIDALVRVDPTPASMGDVHCRSPLHLAMTNCGICVREGDKVAESLLHTQHQQQHQHQKKTLRRHRHWRCNLSMRPTEGKRRIELSERTPGEMLRVAHVLKEAMLTYPGMLDFNDQDKLGYSPLDYAIERGITETALIRTLIQRNDRNNNCYLPRALDSTRLVHSTCCSEEPTTNNSNMEFLQALDHDEMEVLVTKIHNLNPVRQKKWMEYELFKLLIERKDELLRTSSRGVSPAAVDPMVMVVTPASYAGELSSPPSSPPTVTCTCHKKLVRMTYEEIYNKHLQDYFEGYMHELDVGDIQQFEYGGNDGDFDIFVDPEEDMTEGNSMLLDSSVPLCEISVVEDDDLVSML